LPDLRQLTETERNTPEAVANRVFQPQHGTLRFIIGPSYRKSHYALRAPVSYRLLSYKSSENRSKFKVDPNVPSGATS